jgi:quercetin dioxygenase-like cupin family protein
MKLRPMGILLSAALIFSLRLAADETKAATMADHIITPDMVKFAAGPPVLPAGFELASLDGNMMKKGSEYTVRLRFPDGYKIPAHFHPGNEHVTVIQGAFWMGMGDKFDEASLKEMPAGAFHSIPKGVHHYGMAKGQTIIQLHGVGAWGITYVNPADDPRKKSAGK